MGWPFHKDSIDSFFSLSIYNAACVLLLIKFDFIHII